MIDWNEIRIPFKASAVNWLTELSGSMAARINLASYGLTLGSREIIYGTDGSADIFDLNHPWDSLPSSFSSMACKVYDAGCGKYEMPHVIIKASPAKLLQGHNVFGPEEGEEGVFHMLSLLSTAYPSVYDDLDINQAEIRFTDFTYFARASSHSMAREVLQFMRPVSSGQIRPSVSSYATTIYFNNNSRLIDRKAYLKKEELANDVIDIKKKFQRKQISQVQHDTLQDHRLMAFTESMIRFEARYSSRKLERLGIPTNLFQYLKYSKNFKEEQGIPLSQHLWKCAFNKLFKAFEGMTMSRVDDESIKDKIFAKLTTIDINGKLNKRTANSVYRTYQAIKMNGYHKAKKIIPHNTFYVHMKNLESCGLSRAFIQNLEPSAHINVVPFIRFVEINFTQQKPDWYIEPLSSFNKPVQLRAVS